MPRTRQRPGYLLLARVRRSLRALNSSISRGAAAAGLTLQEQAFLLGLAAYGGAEMPLADLRVELEMDQASASVLLRRLTRKRMVVRVVAADRRAAQVSLTSKGWAAFRGSIGTIRGEIRRSDHRGELNALGGELGTYLEFYLRGDRTRRSKLAREVNPRRGTSAAASLRR
jgi:DNA-binding MarR family transcriptional regulator